MRSPPRRHASSSCPTDYLGRDITKRFCTVKKVKKEFIKTIDTFISNGGYKLGVRYNTKSKGSFKESQAFEITAAET